MNIPCPFFAENQKISKKQAENKQKCRGWDLNPLTPGDIANSAYPKQLLSPFSVLLHHKRRVRWDSPFWRRIYSANSLISFFSTLLLLVKSSYRCPPLTPDLIFDDWQQFFGSSIFYSLQVTRIFPFSILLADHFPEKIQSSAESHNRNHSDYSVSRSKRTPSQPALD